MSDVPLLGGAKRSMNTDISTDELLSMYRQLKPLVELMAATLRNRGAINCPECGQKHGLEEAHFIRKPIGVMMRVKSSG